MESKQLPTTSAFAMLSCLVAYVDRERLLWLYRARVGADARLLCAPSERACHALGSSPILIICCRSFAYPSTPHHVHLLWFCLVVVLHDTRCRFVFFFFLLYTVLLLDLLLVFSLSCLVCYVRCARAFLLWQFLRCFSVPIPLICVLVADIWVGQGQHRQRRGAPPLPLSPTACQTQRNVADQGRGD